MSLAQQSHTASRSQESNPSFYHRWHQLGRSFASQLEGDGRDPFRVKLAMSPSRPIGVSRQELLVQCFFHKHGWISATSANSEDLLSSEPLPSALRPPAVFLGRHLPVFYFSKPKPPRSPHRIPTPSERPNQVKKPPRDWLQAVCLENTPSPPS